MVNVIEQMGVTPKPGDMATWWNSQPKADTATPLFDEEQEYLEVFTDPDAVVRIGQGIATEANLSEENKQAARRVFGADPQAIPKFVFRENRRRIVAHYVYTHPATVAYELQLYRTTRDVIPPFFIAERVYELFTGREAFTDDKISRLWAGVELLTAIIIGRVLRYVAPKGPSLPPSRPLTDPIWDLPPEGGGMNINGRWYTEHALERMAPDTPQIRAEMRTRYAARLEKLGIRRDSAAWGPCMERALQKIDPRGVPPSVVEAEIMSRGSTRVKVVTARRGFVVISVIPRK
jgi:hypothetical protein